MTNFTGGLPETKCGAGSTLKCTENLRNTLPPLLKQLEITSLLDAPCGDCNWIAHTDLRGIDYVGVDIDQEMLWLAMAKQPEFPPKSRTLIKGDLCDSISLPVTDAVLCRDFLQHLPNAVALHVIDQLVGTGCRYLLATSHEADANRDIAKVGDFRPLNLRLPPISFAKPMGVIQDPPWLKRYLGIWDVRNLWRARESLQDLDELAELIKLVQQEGVRSYLEIGSKYGGSLLKIGKALPQGSRIVAVDLPFGHGDSRPDLERAIRELQGEGYDAHLFIGDSTDLKIVASVSMLGPFDLCLIDANHTEPYVRQDWANYGQMARMVAFHDISYERGDRKESAKFPIQVPKVWNEIKQGYRHQEIKLCYTKRDNGIGILWR